MEEQDSQDQESRDRGTRAAPQPDTGANLRAMTSVANNASVASTRRTRARSQAGHALEMPRLRAVGKGGQLTRRNIVLGGPHFRSSSICPHINLLHSSNQPNE
jgi:hypothetical protein